MDALPGIRVRKVSDRTFLMQLGGKLEVVPKVPLRHRDDLSRAYTPGVARICQAIAAIMERPSCVTLFDFLRRTRWMLLGGGRSSVGQPRRRGVAADRDG